MKIKATVDKYCYTSKPTDSDAKKMRMRLPQEENYYDIKTIADCVGEQGQAFLPATFKGKFWAMPIIWYRFWWRTRLWKN